MPWLPLMILVVFGVVSLGVLYHTPKEHTHYNIKRVIRGAQPLEPEPEVEPVHVVKETEIESEPMDLTFTPEPGIRGYIAQAGQDKYVDNMLQNKKISHGRFVEFGGYLGDEYSNSWYFEKFYNWHGIMIEAEKKHIEHLKTVRPNAVIYNNAVCPSGIKKIDFASSKISGWGGITEHIDDVRWKSNIANVHSVECVDLNVILEENNMFQVDYMTVDTEGSELAILKTFQFHRFNITFIQVERNVKTKKQQKEKQDLIDFMQTKGYVVENIFDIGNWAVDVLFQKQAILQQSLQKTHN